MVNIALQRHLSMSTKFAHVESRFCGHKQPGKTVFYTPINLCVRKHVYRSVVVGIGELSINVVRMNKPKVLRGLGQNGTVAGTEIPGFSVMDTHRYRRTESTSPIRVNLVERGKPVSLLLKEGKEAVRPTKGDAGKGVGKSAGRLVMRRIRVAPVVSATSPDAQAGRLPCGVSVREQQRNRYRRCCKCRWLCSTGATCPARASTSVQYRTASRWYSSSREI
jgi:hypothetical protein